jgi:LIVCS family branched-chain amino acid:cation transporter
MFGAVISAYIFSSEEYCFRFAVGGYFYLYVASIVNILILLFLSIYCLWIKEKLKNYPVAIGYILLNIPIAAIYAYIGITYITKL